MGCMCCSLSSFVSVCLNAFERATVCTVCAVLTFFLLFTILAVLAIGVGIGFHYCFVTQTVEVMSKAAKLTAGAEDSDDSSRRAAAGMLGRRSNLVRAVEQGLPRGKGVLRNVKRREASGLPPLSNNGTANLLSNNDTAKLTALTSNQEFLPRNVSKFSYI